MNLKSEFRSARGSAEGPYHHNSNASAVQRGLGGGTRPTQSSSKRSRLPPVQYLHVDTFGGAHPRSPYLPSNERGKSSIGSILQRKRRLEGILTRCTPPRMNEVSTTSLATVELHFRDLSSLNIRNPECSLLSSAQLLLTLVLCVAQKDAVLDPYR